jgi:decaprenylphospho-beta-D-erythro-pentofuranosid-2-ulose 2-reductase
MNGKTRIVVIGATSAIAEHCSRLWVQRAPVDLTLIARDAARAAQIAADLRVRSPGSEITTVSSDFVSTTAIEGTVASIIADGPVDTVLIAHGVLSDQALCQDDLAACRDSLEINGISPVLYAEAFAAHFARAGRGTVALIGSVAGDRGRKANYVYGASKGLVARYAEGMQHRFAGSGVKIVLIKPGPTDTPMTAHLKAQGKRLASVQDVARSIVSAIDRGQPVLYVPRKWQLIMLVVRHLPAFIFNRLSI